MPKTALILSILGLIPFLAGGWMVHTAEGGWLGIARYALPLYTALILSFLGGAQWGFALADGANQSSRTFRLIVAMIPSIAAWVVLVGRFASPPNKLLILAALLVLWALIDHIYTTRGWAPRWYPGLRWPVTSLAAASLVVGSLY